MIFKKNKGSGLVEVVIAAAIISTSVVSIFAVHSMLVRFAARNTQHIQAAFLAEEGVEALRVMRNFGWSSNIAPLNNGTTYRLVLSSGKWQTSTMSSMIDNTFDRTIVFSSVSRDGSQNIVSSGGSVDANTKKALITIEWREGDATTTKTMETYIHNIWSN